MGCLVRVGFGYGRFVNSLLLIISLNFSLSLLGRPFSVKRPVVVWFCCCIPAGDPSSVLALLVSCMSAPPCMDVAKYHFWFGRRLGLPLYCDASCLDVCLFLDSTCKWSGRLYYFSVA